MTVLDATEPHTAFTDPESGAFGLTTFKTDAHQTAMARDLDQFRATQQTQQPPAKFANPFASIDVPSMTRDAGNVEDDGQDDLVRGDDASQATSD